MREGKERIKKVRELQRTRKIREREKRHKKRETFFYAKRIIVENSKRN